jgi:hypothetical protein
MNFVSCYRLKLTRTFAELVQNNFSVLKRIPYCHKQSKCQRLQCQESSHSKLNIKVISEILLLKVLRSILNLLTFCNMKHEYA